MIKVRFICRLQSKGGGVFVFGFVYRCKKEGRTHHPYRNGVDNNESMPYRLNDECKQMGHLRKHADRNTIETEHVGDRDFG